MPLMGVHPGFANAGRALRRVVITDPQAPLLDMLGDLTGERVVLLGSDADLAAELRLRGCSIVVENAGGRWVEPGNADVAIAALGINDCAMDVIAQARRALSEFGRVLVWTAEDPAGRIGLAAEAALRRNGFSAIRTVRCRDHSVITAEVPFFGPCLHA
jgi:hypothetical protein